MSTGSSPVKHARMGSGSGMGTPPRGSDRLAYIAVVCLVALGIALRVAHHVVPVYTPDEDANADFYAVPIYDNGLSELPKLVWDYKHAPAGFEHYTSPTRVGHLLPIVALMKLTKRPTIETAAWVSIAASMLALVLIALMGVRFLGAWVAAIALVFAAVSPLDLAMSRRVWGDELLALCALGVLWALLEHAAVPGRGFWAL